MNQNRKIAEIAQSLVTAAGLLGPGDGVMTERHQITAGFMPLLDSALLVAAKEKGFAEAEGVDLVAGARDLLGQHSRPARRRAFPGGAYAGADADRLQSRADPACRRAPSRRWRSDLAATR